MSAIFEPFCYVVWQWKSANLTQILSQVNILKTQVQLSVFKRLCENSISADIAQSF